MKLTGWKSIANYFNVSVRTAIRWANEYNLPTKQHARGASVIADSDELDRWIATRIMPNHAKS